MGYHQHSLAEQWEDAARGFPAERLGFKGKARELDQGFPLYEAEGGEALNEPSLLCQDRAEFLRHGFSAAADPKGPLVRLTGPSPKGPVEMITQPQPLAA